MHETNDEIRGSIQAATLQRPIKIVSKNMLLVLVAEGPILLDLLRQPCTTLH